MRYVPGLVIGSLLLLVLAWALPQSARMARSTRRVRSRFFTYRSPWPQRRDTVSIAGALLIGLFISVVIVGQSAHGIWGWP